jgi:hypothetical protein
MKHYVSAGERRTRKMSSRGDQVSRSAAADRAHWQAGVRLALGEVRGRVEDLRLRQGAGHVGDPGTMRVLTSYLRTEEELERELRPHTSWWQEGRRGVGQVGGSATVSRLQQLRQRLRRLLPFAATIPPEVRENDTLIVVVMSSITASVNDDVHSL